MITTRGNKGNYYYGARYYVPQTSIWLSVDPLAMHPKQLDKSPYAFSWNNPVRYVDPDGRCPECEENVENPELGETYESSGGRTYQYQNTYDEDGNKTGAAWTGLGGKLAEVEVDGGEMSDHARALRAGRELGIYQGQNDFLKGSAQVTAHITGKFGEGISYVGYGAAFIPGAQPVAGSIIAVGNGLSTVSSASTALINMSDGDYAGAALNAGNAIIPGRAHKLIDQNVARGIISTQGGNILKGGTNMKSGVADYLINR